MTSNLLRKLLGHTLMEEADEAGAGGGGAAAAGGDDDTDIDAGRPDDISAAEWAELSPAEREAIAAGDGDETDVDTLAAIAAAGGDGADDESAAAAASAAAAEEEAAAAAAAGDPAPFVPVFKANLPADFDAQVQAVKDERNDLKVKFREGDLELDEYETQREALDDRLAELNTLKVKAEIAADNEKQTVEQRWAWECDTFYADEANAIYKDPILAAAHNAAVSKLGREAEDQPEKFPERAKWNGMRFLREADKMVRASMGVKPADPVTPAADGKAPRNIKPTPPSAIPPAINKLPVAASANVGADEFADMAGLEGVDYERAIARLSPEQRERFMASA